MPRASTLASLFALCLALCACDTGPAPSVPFDGHTAASFKSASEFDAFCVIGQEPHTCKFELTRFQEPAGQAFFPDLRFYGMHDEWFTFRMMNGVGIDGFEVAPIKGHRFDTLDQIRAFFKDKVDMPLGLVWYDTRLYSTWYYARALGDCIGGPAKGCPRFFGVGVLQHWQPDPARTAHPGEVWDFILEGPDQPTVAEIEQFFHRLRPLLPPAARDALCWQVNTEQYQIGLAFQLQLANNPLADHLCPIKEFSQP